MDLKMIKEIPPWEWPADADETILEVLRNKGADDSDRLLAAELAGEIVVINDDLVEALLDIVNDSDAHYEQRAKAVISFGPVLEHADTDGFEDPDDVSISEGTFQGLQESLRKLYMDASVPKEVRRRTLEAAVNAPQDWHRDAVRAAWAADDEEWMLTAVFCMRFLRGFDEQIIEALESEKPEIHYEAVCAAGNWELDAAWPHISRLIQAKDTDKPLMLAAIDAVVGICPEEAGVILVDLTDSDDQDIVDAVDEAMVMAEGLSDDEFLDS